jgi:hypothetical protein
MSEQKIHREALKLAQRIDAAWSMKAEAEAKGEYSRARRMKELALGLERQAEKFRRDR